MAFECNERKTQADVWIDGRIFSIPMSPPDFVDGYNYCTDFPIIGLHYIEPKLNWGLLSLQYPTFAQ